MVCAGVIKGTGSSYLVIAALQFLAAEPSKTMKNESVTLKWMLKMKLDFQNS